MRIGGFEHRPGHHCGSACLRNLADFYGWGLSEAESFGLASGLGFSYFELPDSPERAFFGRPLWLEEAFFENASVPHGVTEGDDWETAWPAVCDHLDAGTPVMLFVDLYYLDYYGTDTHFSPHSVLAVGYDEQAGTVCLSDSEFEAVQELPLERLREAWASKHVMPLQNKSLVVTDPTAAVDIETVAPRAVAETATYMLDPPAASQPTVGFGEHGVAGERAFATDLPEWTALDDPAWAARFAYQNVERRGTGGGAFRRLYAEFLAAVAPTVPGLDAMTAERMRSVADDWTELADTLKAASEADGTDERTARLERAGERAAALADREEALYRTIDESV